MRVGLLKFHRLHERGQTALEYAMILMVLMIPLAMAVRSVFGPVDSGASASLDKSSKPQNGMQKIVFDSYGNEKRMGIIGRPYP